MPTKKRRVGFIPRNDVLDIINKLSYENNLSYSKIINILVEEALQKRGLLNITNAVNFGKKNKSGLNKIGQETLGNFSREFNYNFNNNLLRDKTFNLKELKEDSLDDEIYKKFLIFLQFQERMRNRNP